MNVTVNIDCTPEEARRFMGLPDLTPLHAAYVDKLQTMIGEGIGPVDVERMMRAWMPFSETGFEAWRKLFQPGTSEPTG